jgi:hypothetical protein
MLAVILFPQSTKTFGDGPDGRIWQGKHPKLFLTVSLH